jgi:chromosome segregation ATPase
MLTEVTGTKAFDERLQKMSTALEEARGKREVLRSILTEIEAKLEGLQVDKETYAQIEAIELKKKSYQKLILLAKNDTYD